MKSKIYSNKKLIGTSELQITDESMGVVSGKFIPNENYEEIRKTIWKFHDSNSNNIFEELERLRINCQLENEIFLYPIGGFLITDLEDLPNEDLEFEAAGNYRHIIEGNFLANPAKERISYLFALRRGRPLMPLIKKNIVNYIDFYTTKCIIPISTPNRQILSYYTLYE